MTRRHQWATWDWTRSNAQLGRDHGYTRERIRQIRKTLGKRQSRGQKTDLTVDRMMDLRITAVTSQP